MWQLSSNGGRRRTTGRTKDHKIRERRGGRGEEETIHPLAINPLDFGIQFSDGSAGCLQKIVSVRADLDLDKSRYVSLFNARMQTRGVAAGVGPICLQNAFMNVVQVRGAQHVCGLGFKYIYPVQRAYWMQQHLHQFQDPAVACFAILARDKKG